MAASTQNATASELPRKATKSAASGYPATSASESPSQIAELAATSSSSLTIRGITAVRAGRKKIETVVRAKTSG